MNAVRAWSVLVILVGCGRVDFDPHAAADDAPAGCLAGYSMLGEGCYRFVINTMEVSWFEAEVACEADGAGAHLVVPDTVEEIALLTPQFTAAQDAWMGGNDLMLEGSYLRVIGGPALIAWGSSEPDGDGEDCMQILSAENLLADRDCTETNDYICEYDGIPVDPTAF